MNERLDEMIRDIKEFNLFELLELKEAVDRRVKNV